MAVVRFGRKVRHRTLRLRAYTRFKHHRGHGVHSPFVYSLVRKVFMKRKIAEPYNTELYESLRKAGIRKYPAVQLQNLHTFCKYRGFVTDSGENDEITEHFLYIVIPKKGAETGWLLNKCGEYRKSTLVVMSPYNDAATLNTCKELIAGGECTSIDNRRYMIFFYDKNLPVQHFKL